MMRRARPLLGTLVDIAAEGPADSLPAAIETAFASIAQVQRLMSFHDPDSDVSRVNGAEPGREISVDPQTFCVLEFAQRLSEISEGVFDITIAPSLVENGFLPERPLEDIPRGASYRDLELLPGYRVRWRRKGWIDLGGIAKGYAVDCAVVALRSHAAATAIINAGGDLRCFGMPQPIHVRHPDEPMMLMGLGFLTDAAFATSAGYCSYLENNGRRINPLVDPRRGNCLSWDGSISVAADDGMTADALTKVIRLKPDHALEFLEFFGAQAIVIDRAGVRCCGRPLATRGRQSMTKHEPMTKYVRQAPIRLSRRHERWIYAVGLLTLVSGLSWLGDHYLFAGSAEFGDARAPSEPLWLRLHGAAAMVGLVVLGSLVPSHIVRAWRSRMNFTSGLFMLCFTMLLVLTGYGLYYVGDEQTRPWISIIHWLVGTIAAAGLAIHVLLGKRQTRRPLS